VKAKALHRDAFFQIITGSVIITHCILAQQKGNRMCSNRLPPPLLLTLLSQASRQQRIELKQLFYFGRFISFDVSYRHRAAIFGVKESYQVDAEAIGLREMRRAYTNSPSRRRRFVPTTFDNNNKLPVGCRPVAVIMRIHKREIRI
jgi:hypothetical protein